MVFFSLKKKIKLNVNPGVVEEAKNKKNYLIRLLFSFIKSLKCFLLSKNDLILVDFVFKGSLIFFSG